MWTCSSSLWLHPQVMDAVIGAACGSQDANNMGKKTFSRSVAMKVNVHWVGVNFRCIEFLFFSFSSFPPFPHIREMLLRRSCVECEIDREMHMGFGHCKCPSPTPESDLFFARMATLSVHQPSGQGVYLGWRCRCALWSQGCLFCLLRKEAVPQRGWTAALPELKAGWTAGMGDAVSAPHGCSSAPQA